ncbi:hypothetical protein Tco_1186759 [Tanacetum coccineum]
MNFTKGSSSNLSKKIKLTIIPPIQLFVNISSDEDVTTTPYPTTTYVGIQKFLQLSAATYTSYYCQFYLVLLMKNAIVSDVSSKLVLLGDMHELLGFRSSYNLVLLLIQVTTASST